MRENPIGNALAFLVATDKLWFTVIFWLLARRQRCGCGAGVAGRSGAAFPASYRLRPDARHHWHHVVAAVAVEDTATLGLGTIHWMEVMVEHASTQLQSTLVSDFVLPNINVFGPLVYAIEVFIAVSLILGVFTRIGAALGALMAINLWLGLYNAPGEWPWTYMFLVVLQLIFLINPPGRSLGIDALAWGRESTARKDPSILSLVA